MPTTLPCIIPPSRLAVETTSNRALDELNALLLLQQEGYDLAEYVVDTVSPTGSDTAVVYLERISTDDE